MAVALAGLALLLGLVLGWLAHHAVSIHYRKRWLDLVAVMNAKVLEPPDEPDAGPRVRTAPSVASQAVRQAAYIPGKWALDERTEGIGTAFYAIRMGFDDVPLGKANSKYAGVVKMARSNAEQAVAEMNDRT